MLMKTFFTMSLSVALCICRTRHVNAITYGQADNGEHPYVGALLYCSGLFDAPDTFCGSPCGGSLVETADGNSAFLTTADCVVDLVQDRQIYVTFDEVLDVDFTAYTQISQFFKKNEVYHVSTWVAHPEYNPKSKNYANDLAILFLDENVIGIEPATIAPLGKFNQLYPSIKSLVFSVAGYGDTRSDSTGGQSINGVEKLTNWKRLKTTQYFQSLQGQDWVAFTMNANKDSGGSCFRDSGTPHVVQGTNEILAVSVTGDHPCVNLDRACRLDSVAANAFLINYLAVP